MGVNKPVVTILRGDDTIRMQELVETYKRELGAADMASLNTSVLDGKTASLDDIRSATLTLPFLAPRRLVVMHEPLERFEGKKNEDQAKFLALLDSLPESTHLVLLLEDHLLSKAGKTFWERFTPKHWLMEWVKDAGERATVLDCALPTAREMTAWVQRKAKEAGGVFTTDGAARLAEYVGNNTRRALLEIDKLLTYVNKARPVSGEDVTLLTFQEQEGNIFDLVDAIGERNGRAALAQLQILLERSDALEISGMITRQYRLLLLAREILDERGGEDRVRDELNLHPFVAQKLTTQARRFKIAQLEDIYRRLLKIDLDIKTGGIPGDVAYEVLVAELAGG